MVDENRDWLTEGVQLILDNTQVLYNHQWHFAREMEAEFDIDRAYALKEWVEELIDEFRETWEADGRLLYQSDDARLLRQGAEHLVSHFIRHGLDHTNWREIIRRAQED